MTVKSTQNDLMTLAFSVYSNPGSYALLIGSGVSAASGIPTAWGVRQKLTSMVALQAGKDPDDIKDTNAWYEETYGNDAEYQPLLERLAPTPWERKSILQDIFKQTEEERQSGLKEPTDAHHAIARLVADGYVKVIVTLNFDHLIEKAIRAQGIDPVILSSNASLEGMEPLHTQGCRVIHLHGEYQDPSSMLNTYDELAAYSPPRQELLEQIVREYGLIIAGWSGVYDPQVHDAIRSKYSARQTMGWFEPHEASKEAQDLIKEKKGFLLRISADEGFSQLSDAVRAMKAREARHPLLVAAAVETAKRELAGRAVAISVHDRFKREIVRVHEGPHFVSTNLPMTPKPDVVAAIEEATTVAAALTATLAYWGSPQTDTWWMNEIRRLAAPTPAEGLVWHLNLKLFSAAALYYAAGIAALAGNRHEVLARLLNMSRPEGLLGGREYYGSLLSADRLYAEHSMPPNRIHGYLAPVLEEALSISSQELDDAWQEFEALRLAARLQNSPAFSDHFAGYTRAASDYDLLRQKNEASDRNATLTEEARAQLRRKDRTRNDLLSGFGQLLDVGAPHLFTTHVNDSDFHVPAVERLLDSLATEGEYHPLISAGFSDSQASLFVSLSGVAKAAGKQGSDYVFRYMVNKVGSIIPSAWLDDVPAGGWPMGGMGS
ncbi:SIR2 family protein [Pseudarthrobacter sp. ATCC 49987]|uniref:SIR2 family protein n=1 Tax=Pseudarthrobacter sp. ATCC 49987 TaxID=2698204 RepID=UPI00136FDDE1|nr:SIR2 family protein [Pseudarthrobacter sp. ATCC 49987]